MTRLFRPFVLANDRTSLLLLVAVAIDQGRRGTGYRWSDFNTKAAGPHLANCTLNHLGGHATCPERGIP